MIEFILKNFQVILSTVIPTIMMIIATYKLRLEVLDRKHIKNFELAYKYFSKKEINTLKDEHPIIRDMACNMITYFKGLTFDNLFSILNANSKLSLYDFIKMRVIIKCNYIYWNGTSYEERYKFKLTLGKFKFICYSLFFVYASFGVYLTMYLNTSLNISLGLLFLFMVCYIVIPEVYMLNKINRREIMDWFIKNKKQFDFKGNIILN